MYTILRILIDESLDLHQQCWLVTLFFHFKTSRTSSDVIKKNVKTPNANVIQKPVNLRMTDNTMAKRKMTKEQTTIYKTL